jgi:hypothetical protein
MGATRGRPAGFRIHASDPAGNFKASVAQGVADPLACGTVKANGDFTCVAFCESHSVEVMA